MRLASTMHILSTWTLFFASCGQGLATGADTGTQPDSTADSSDDIDVPQEAECVTDGDCDDAVFCNGHESCVEGHCTPGTEVVCDDSDSCTTDTCDEGAGACAFGDRDEDGDGHVDAACGGDDCDDMRGDTHPGSTTLGCLDGVDQDCDTVPDDDTLLVPEILLGESCAHLERPPAMTWTGSAWAVAWSRHGETGGTEVMLSLVAEDGISATGEQVVVPAVSVDSYPDLAWTGSSLALAWHDMPPAEATEVFVAMLDPTGVMVGTATRITSAPAPSQFAGLAWTGSELGIAWQDTRDGNWSVYFARLAPGSGVTGERALTDALSYASEHPRILWTGSEYVLGWVDDRDGNDEVYLARLDGDGTPVGSHVRLTDTPGGTSDLDLAWTGSTIGAVYRDERGGGRGLYLVRLDPTGVRLGAEFQISTLSDPMTIETGRPAIEWTVDGLVTCWQDFTAAGGPPASLYVSHIDAGGSSYTPAVQIATDPALASGNCMLVWSGSVLGIGWERQVLGTDTEILFGMAGRCL